MPHSNGIRVIAWIILAIINGDVTRGQTGPNAVTLINGLAVSLDCAVSSMASTQWTRTTDGSSNTLLIASGCSVSGNTAAYYNTEQPGGNICRLIIGNATMQMGGVYTCFDGSSTTYRSLVTVVDPVASVVVYNTSEVKEGGQLNISCSINYNGPSPPAPSLHPSPYWTSPGQIFTSAIYYPSSSIVTLIATITAQKQTVPIFYCHTVFEITGGSTTGYNMTAPADNLTVGNTTFVMNVTSPASPCLWYLFLLLLLLLLIPIFILGYLCYQKNLPCQTKAPVFESFLKDLTVTEGDDASFECTVSARRPATISWHNDAGLITSENDHFTQTYDNKVAKLFIANTDQEDMDTYTCTAKNAGVEKTIKAKLVVNVNAPVFESFLKDLTVTEGDDASFECTVSARRPATISWHNDAGLIASDDGHFTQTYDNKVAKIFIANTEQEDMGTYTCTAKNDGGEVEVKAKLVVNVNAPVFESFLKDLTVKEGDDASFECTVSARRPPTISWYNDAGLLISDDGHFTQTYDNKVAKLFIANTNQEYMGIYTCTAKNYGGEDTVKAQLVVNVNVDPSRGTNGNVHVDTESF